MAPVGICSTARETSDGTPLREANERTVSLACRAPRSRSGTGLRRWGSTVYVRSSVGRQSEIRRLEELVEAVRAGRSRAVAGLLRPVRRALATACRLRRPAAAGRDAKRCRAPCGSLATATGAQRRSGGALATMVAEGQTNRNQPHAARPLAAGGPATHRGCSDSSLCHGGRVVSVDWGDWSSFEGSPGRELGGLKPAAARRYFDALMAARPARRVALERLLERNHAPISIADDGLQRLNDWYGENVSGADGRLVARWYAVGLDVALYIADAMIARAPGLEWRMYTKRRQALSYQRPVLMGF